MRRYLDDAGFLEVETPVLQRLYGGALARPFETHYNALDRDSLPADRDRAVPQALIVGGLERVYEIGKDFRNEGFSHKHNPEFTMLEWYEAYADYEDIAARSRSWWRAPPSGSGYDGRVDWSPPWDADARRRDPRGVPASTSTSTRERDALAAASEAKDMHAPPTRTGPSSSTSCFTKHVEPKLINPTFLMDYPVELSPFAKRPPRRRRGSSSASRHSPADGVRQRLHRAERPRRSARAFRGAGPHAEAGDEEAQPFDEDFVARWSTACRRPAASAWDRPPGDGADRARSIREVLLFPAMRD